MVETKNLLKLCPEGAIAKFLIKGQVLEKVFRNVSALHLRSALLACFSDQKQGSKKAVIKLTGINVFVFNA